MLTGGEVKAGPVEVEPVQAGEPIYGGCMTIDLPSGQQLEWIEAEGDASFRDGVLTMSAGERTDWFNDPAGSASTANAPVLVAPVLGDCQLSARVQVEFGATFDAGVLFVHQSADDYAKLCFERSPIGEHTVVSVVTRTTSDDANGPAIEGDVVYLRVSKVGAAVAFHWSLDDTYWTLLRYFRLRDPASPISIGFCSQSPTGEGCTSTFGGIRWSSTTLADVRDGS